MKYFFKLVELKLNDWHNSCSYKFLVYLWKAEIATQSEDKKNKYQQIQEWRTSTNREV